MAVATKHKTKTTQAEREAELRERLTKLEADIADMENKLNEWLEKHAEAQRTLEDAVASGRNGRALTAAVLEAQTGVNVHKRKLDELNAQRVDVERRLAHLVWRAAWEQAHKQIAELEALDAKLDAEMLDRIRVVYHERQTKAAMVQRAISRANAMHQVGGGKMITWTDHIGDLSAGDWVAGLIRQATIDGRLR